MPMNLTRQSTPSISTLVPGLKLEPVSEILAPACGSAPVGSCVRIAAGKGEGGGTLSVPWTTWQDQSWR